MKIKNLNHLYFLIFLLFSISFISAAQKKNIVQKKESVGVKKIKKTPLKTGNIKKKPVVKKVSTPKVVPKKVLLKPKVENAIGSLVFQTDMDLSVSVNGSRTEMKRGTTSIPYPEGNYVILVRDSTGSTLGNALQVSLGQGQRLPVVLNYGAIFSEKKAFAQGYEAYNRQDYRVALRAYESVRNSPRWLAQDAYAYAKCLSVSDKDFKPDFKLAVEFYKKAAQNPSSSESLVALGYLYAQGGNGLEKSMTTALRYFEQATQLGNTEAKHELGQILFYGTSGVTPNETKGLAYLLEAGNELYQPSAYLLGVIYSKGSGTVPKDMAKAKYWFKKVAKGNTTSKKSD